MFKSNRQKTFKTMCNSVLSNFHVWLIHTNLFSTNPIWIHPTDNVDTQRHLWEFFGTARLRHKPDGMLLGCSIRSKHTHRKAFYPLPNVIRLYRHNEPLFIRFCQYFAISWIFSLVGNLEFLLLKFKYQTGFATQNAATEVLHLPWGKFHLMLKIETYRKFMIFFRFKSFSKKISFNVIDVFDAWTKL